MVSIASFIISELLWIEASVKSDVHEPPSIPAGPSSALEPEKIRKHRSGLHLQRNTAIISSSSITRRFLRRSQPEPNQREITAHQTSVQNYSDERCVNITSERTSDLCSGATNRRTEEGYLTHTANTEQSGVTSGDVQIEETHPQSTQQLWWRSVSLLLNWSSSSRWTSGSRATAPLMWARCNALVTNQISVHNPSVLLAWAVHEVLYMTLNFYSSHWRYHAVITSILHEITLGSLKANRKLEH